MTITFTVSLSSHLPGWLVARYSFLLLTVGLLLPTISWAEAPDRPDWVVFVASVEDNWDLFVADADGGNLKQLTSTPYDEIDPAWSCDMSKIAYAATDGVLRVLTLTSGEVQEFAPEKPRTRYIQPSFSPDGHYVAFAMHTTEEEDNADLAIADLESGKIEVVLAQRSLQLFPSWSPDGSCIYYANVTCATECGRVIQDVWCLPLDTHLPRQVTLTNAHCRAPDPSPDGLSLLFSSDYGGFFDLWIYRTDAGSLRQLTTTAALDSDPSWSADGRTVVFASSRGGSMGIYFLQVDAGKTVRFNPFGEKDVPCKNPDF